MVAARSEAGQVGWLRMASRYRADRGMGSGGVAQLGERLVCNQEAIGSIPFTSTILETRRVFTPRI